MTRSNFFVKNGVPVGFELEGHTGFDEEGFDVVCAAVSSAAYMTVNTITEVCGADADVVEKTGFLRMVLQGSSANDGLTVLRGFLLHMEQLAGQYPDCIDFHIREL